VPTVLRRPPWCNGAVAMWKRRANAAYARPMSLVVRKASKSAAGCSSTPAAARRAEARSRNCSQPSPPPRGWESLESEGREAEARRRDRACARWGGALSKRRRRARSRSPGSSNRSWSSTVARTVARRRELQGAGERGGGASCTRTRRGGFALGGLPGPGLSADLRGEGLKNGKGGPPWAAVFCGVMRRGACLTPRRGVPGLGCASTSGAPCCGLASHDTGLQSFALLLACKTSKGSTGGPSSITCLAWRKLPL